MSKVVIYTDGASSGNPGPGGFGTVLTAGSLRKEVSGGYRKTTNNRQYNILFIMRLSLISDARTTIVHTPGLLLIYLLYRTTKETDTSN